MTKKVSEDDVQIEEVAKPRGYTKYWHVFCSGVRVGRVYINTVDGVQFITVMLNKPSQGMGIGRICLCKACRLSQFEEVYATIRKSNKASLKVAEYAGFQPVSGHVGPQAKLVWRSQNNE